MSAKLFKLLIVVSFVLTLVGGFAPTFAQEGYPCDFPLNDGSGTVIPNALDDGESLELGNGTVVYCVNGRLLNAPESTTETDGSVLGAEVCPSDVNGETIFMDDLVNQAAISPAQKAELVEMGVEGNMLIHVGTEAGLWQWNGFPHSGYFVFPLGTVVTAHLFAGEVTTVFVGDGVTVYRVHRLSMRVVDCYPLTDKVRDNPPCSMVASETQNGLWSLRPFHAVGNFECPGLNTANMPGATTTNPTVGDVTCPIFNGVQTLGTTTNGCKFGPIDHLVSDNVPVGWRVDYWDGANTRHAVAGAEITTSEATFWPAGS